MSYRLDKCKYKIEKNITYMKIKLRETIVCVININKVTDFSALNYINKLTFRMFPDNY